VDAGDALVLRAWTGDPAEPALALRARIVLLCRDGHGPSAVAERARCTKQTVIVWRERYRREGLSGLRDAPRSGRPATVDPTDVLVRTLRPRWPEGARWSTRSLAAELGISNVAVGNVWREWGITPVADGRVAWRTEPVLDAPVVDVLGLHVDPPLYVVAVGIGERAEPATAPRALPVLHGLLEDVLAVAAPGEGDPTAAKAFFTQLDHAIDNVRARGAVTGVALIAAGDTEAVLDYARDRASVTVHTVAGVPVWDRLVRLGCLLAGAEPAGTGSVRALRAAVTCHGLGPFSWIAPAP
jgi:transposase